ncbi:MAG: hypothetical protein ACO3JL_00370 [Myxococcota bacterium]
MTRLPVIEPLCQHSQGSCGACCGIYNFTDRSADATAARLRRRTQKVREAWPEESALAAVRDQLLDEERPQILYATVKVCPFAGFVDDDRVGCLLHPTLHPTGEDLRHLAVYPREVCRDHFCAPHEWLRPIERRLAQAAQGPAYGLVVTDAGLVKGVRALLEETLRRPLQLADIDRASAALAALWRDLIAWPHRDPDPRRFGGFVVQGDDAVERTIPSCLSGLDVGASRAAQVVLDGLGTLALNEERAKRALQDLRRLVHEAACAIDETLGEFAPRDG